MDLQLVSLVIVGFFCVICALLVLFSPQITWIRRATFAVCQLGLTFWLVNLYFSNVISQYSLLINRLVYIGLIIAVSAFGIFINTLAQPSPKKGWYDIFIPCIALASLVVSVLPSNVKGLQPRIGADGQFGGYSIVFGGAANLLILLLLILVATVLLRLYLVYRNVTNTKDALALRIIFRAVIITAIIVVIVNLLIPITIGGSAIGNLVGTLSLLIFVIGFSYSLLRHSFLDVRLIVVRSVAYAATLATVGVVYTLMLLLVSSTILSSQVSLTGLHRAFYIAFAVLLALTFEPLRATFNRITNKIFYQDVYDPQIFLNELNSVLVSTIELEKLLHSCATVIADNLKAQFCVFGLRESGAKKLRVVGSAKFEVTTEKTEELARLLAKVPHLKVVVADTLPDEHSKLREYLQQYDIAVLARLSDATHGMRFGGLALGLKKSGNPYSSQDIKTINIVTDELVIAIQNALRFEEIQNFNLTLQERVNDATRKLRRTNEKLRALDESKDEFISMASHQLRTPLTSVKGYVSMVLEGDAGKLNKSQRELLDQSYISAQRMVYLIADLLNVSRLRTGKFIIEPQPTNLAAIIEGEITSLTETAKGRELELFYHKPKNFPTLMLDETKIRQVIMNFVDNAIYYTPAGGHIQVNLVETDKTIEFTVVDDGIGVPPAEQHHLFTKFYRAGNARQARPDGTGLGLFMAKKVIVAQGGSLVFKSQEGKGSTFGFTFAKEALSPANYKGPLSIKNSR